MSSRQTIVDFILEQSATAGAISSRKMFGEYAIYCDGKLIALVCDDQLYVKPTAGGRAFLGDVTERAPYDGAKPLFHGVRRQMGRSGMDGRTHTYLGGGDSSSEQEANGETVRPRRLDPRAAVAGRQSSTARSLAIAQRFWIGVRCARRRGTAFLAMIILQVAIVQVAVVQVAIAQAAEPKTPVVQDGPSGPVQAWRAAMEAGDLAALARMHDAGTVAFPPNTTETKGAAAILGGYAALFKTYTARVMVADAHWIEQPPLVVSWGLTTLVLHPKAGGQDIVTHTRFTDAAIKIGGGWRYVVDHASIPKGR